ncbi:MAG: hypothetical protein FRX49_03387, partial [Trebouxia sp. A1-2]
LESIDADLYVELSSLGQGSPGLKPELLTVEDGSCLRHDPDAAVVVTELWQLFVSGCSAVDTAFVATAFGAVDIAFGAWHDGHSLWASAVEQRTQPCGALHKWTSALRSGPAANSQDGHSSIPNQYKFSLQDWDEGTLDEQGQFTPESDVYQIRVMLLKFQEVSAASRAFADKLKSKSISAVDAAEDTYFL